MKPAILSVIFVGLLAGGLYAGDKDKAPEKLEAKVVDSGSFGIYMAGKRIGTETFKIEQRPDVSVATAELKVEAGNVQATQNAEMRVGPNGELRSYIWHSTSPKIEEASVEPRDQLLVEHIAPFDQKKVDVPHMLPLSTVILDDNFFSQREVLIWRYLATGCVWKPGENPMCGPAKYVVLVPHDHTSANATVELVGEDKVMVKGVEQPLNKITLRLGQPEQLRILNGEAPPDSGQWVLWVNDQYKVIKIAIAGTNFEVIRD